MTKNSYFLTTPIYYVNDVPHIGHAYTSIAADVLARHYRLIGREVFFLTGTDEHGAKIAEAAEKKNMSPKEFVNGLVPRFEAAWKALDISYDQFIRTTNPKHEKIVAELIEKVSVAGYIEKRKYEGLYCISCERFYSEDELVDGKCPDHKRECVIHAEENYFFLLAKVAKDFKLAEKIKSDEINIRPLARKNEVLGKIKKGLEDVSISRENVKWGIKFPNDPSQTIYVWIDALINYYTATKIYQNSPSWPANLHIMAKDILWFHGIIWPAFLLAAGLETPKEIFAHGFFTIDGQKMSKTIGNVLDPITLSERYGTDAIRFALLREFPFGEDGDISEEKVANRYAGELGNDLGNLLQRTISMINKYGLQFEYQSSDYQSVVAEKIENLEFDRALDELMAGVREQNKKIEEERPWELARTNPKRLEQVLSEIYQYLGNFAVQIDPFMPETAGKMKKQLESLSAEPLFPRIEE